MTPGLDAAVEDNGSGSSSGYGLPSRREMEKPYRGCGSRGVSVPGPPASAGAERKWRGWRARRRCRGRCQRASGGRRSVGARLWCGWPRCRQEWALHCAGSRSDGVMRPLPPDRFPLPLAGGFKKPDGIFQLPFLQASIAQENVIACLTVVSGRNLFRPD